MDAGKRRASGSGVSSKKKGVSTLKSTQTESANLGPIECWGQPWELTSSRNTMANTPYHVTVTQHLARLLWLNLGPNTTRLWELCNRTIEYLTIWFENKIALLIYMENKMSEMIAFYRNMEDGVFTDQQNITNVSSTSPCALLACRLADIVFGPNILTRYNLIGRYDCTVLSPQ